MWPYNWERDCIICHRAPPILAKARCGHGLVCFPCNEVCTSRWFSFMCPTCGDPFFGFSWHFLSNVVDGMKWELEMELIMLNVSHEDFENPFSLLRLGAAPLPARPSICARCGRDPAIFCDENMLQLGYQAVFCGRCALAILEIMDNAPLIPDLINLE